MNKSALAAAMAICAACGGAFVFHLTQHPSPSRRSIVVPKSRADGRVAADAAPPGAPPIQAVDYQPIAAQTAEEINRAVPLADVGPAAQPFSIAGGTPTWERAAHCLAQAVYYEAGSESGEGQKAVAQVVLNRVRSPAFPNTICGVVYQGSERASGCQFTFTCDGSLRREPSSTGWRRAQAVAAAALRGQVFAPVGNATHYHANYVVPYWAASMAKIRAIGAHEFYRWPGKWRALTYFSQRYANVEPENLAVAAVVPAVPPPVTKPIVLPPLLAADRAFAEDHLMAAAPAIDRKPHTLIVGENAPWLDPKLDRIVILSADLHAGPLAPTRMKDRTAQ